jgi:hypothetical protein
MRFRHSVLTAVAVASTVAVAPSPWAPAAAAPYGHLTFAVHVSLAPTGSIPPRRPAS